MITAQDMRPRDGMTLKPVRDLATALYADLLRRRASDHLAAAVRCYRSGNRAYAEVMLRRSREFLGGYIQADSQARGVGQSPTADRDAAVMTAGAFAYLLLAAGEKLPRASENAFAVIGQGLAP